MTGDLVGRPYDSLLSEMRVMGLPVGSPLLFSNMKSVTKLVKLSG